MLDWWILTIFILVKTHKNFRQDFFVNMEEMPDIFPLSEAISIA